MSTSKKRFKAKRVLAMLLALAMTLQSVPMTAMAAETPEAADGITGTSSDEVAEETSAEAGQETESDDTGSDEEEPDQKEADENPSDGAASDEGQSEDGVDQSEQDAAQTEEPDESEGQEQKPAAEEKGEDTDNATDEQDGDAVTAAAEIVVDYATLQRRANSSGFSYDTETKTIISEYSKNNLKPFETIANAIKDYDISINLDHNSNAVLKTHVSYAWIDSAGNAIADAGPSEAGEYQLKVTLPTVAGVYDGEAISTTINFRIEKRDVGIEYNGSEIVVPGTPVKDVKDAVKENYTLSIEGMLLDTGNRAAYVQSDTVTIQDAHSNAVLNDSDKLLQTQDYVLELTVVLKEEYAKNYNITNNIVNINMEDTIATKITVVSEVNPDGSNYGKVYDANKIDEASIKTLLGATVVEEDSQEVIADAEITYTWLDANRTKLDSDEDVKDAGTYYMVLTYAGKEGHYREASREITVVISTADIAIEPVLKTGVTLYAGMTVKEALKKAVDTYKVYQTDSTPVGDLTEAVKADPYFWGISYNNTNRTQAYEPVFYVEQGITTEAEDGSKSTVWNPLGNNTLLTKEENVQYRIIFSGKKAVYGSNGYEAPVDINASQENYRVDLSRETLEQYAKPIEVLGCDPASIDVTTMYNPAFNTSGAGDAGKSFDNAIRRDYNGKQLFEKRNEYKKAVVKAANVSDPLAQNTDAELKYTWQYFTGEYNYYAKDEDGNFVDDDGNVIDASDSRYIRDEADDSVLKEPVYEDYSYYGYNANVEYISTPVDVGDYRIEISYVDPQKRYRADNQYVYYTIRKKAIKVQFEETDLAAYEGVSIGEFISKIDYTYEADGTRTYVKHKIVGGTVTEGQNGAYTFTPDAEQNMYLREGYYEEYGYEYGYDLLWYVERLVKEGPDAGTYVKLRDSDKFIMGETYRLGVYFGDDNEYLYGTYGLNYYNRYALDWHNNYRSDADGNVIIAYENDTADIAVNETEGIVLNVEVDWSKVADLTKVYDGQPLTFAETGIDDAVIITNPKDGSLIRDAKVQYQWLYDDNGWYISENEAIHVSDYYFVVRVEQDEKYAERIYTFDGEDDKVFSIIPRELTVTPVLKEEITAGTYINSNNVADTVGKLCAADPLVTGYEDIAADREFFEENKTYVTEAIFYPRAISLSLSITEKGAAAAFNGYLSGSKSYNVSYTGSMEDLYLEHVDWEEQIFWAKDYKVVFETVAFTPVRGTSTVASTAANNIVQTRLNDSISGDAENGYTHTITPREGVVYTTSGYDMEGTALAGNYFVFKITAPDEYINGGAPDAVYENSIKKTGYLLNVTSSSQRPVYTVAFDASEKDQKEFVIIWENGYQENFVVDFTNCILMDDLTKAVAPKSLAFNGASSKMTVGEGQQLDLKITKKQMSDVICILYESSDDSIVEVSDRGYVTAIKKGQATVTAYPAYETADGKKEKLTDAKGKALKGASLKITVSDLTAVKAVKTEAHDTYAYLTYTLPAGGYRREIYVAKSSKTDKKTAQYFEDEIAKVTNGNYDAFATTPIFSVNESGQYLSKGKYYYHRIGNLEPNQQYTVYVRNVGALRTTADGYKAESKPAGVVSTFTTTKAQETRLYAHFDTENTAVVYDNDLYEYQVNIAAKKVPLSVDAYFYEKYDENKGYSDEADYIWRTLPLSKDDQKIYVNPKLTYYVTDAIEWYDGDELEDKTLVRIGNYVFRPTSKIASIDKKGQISLKGVGTVYVLAYNADTQHYAETQLHIISEADGLTGKNMKLKVGNKVRITDYLTYKQKNITLNGYCDEYLQDLVIDYTPNDSYELTYTKASNGAIKECWIIAKKADKAKFEISVSDRTVIKNGGKAAKVVVTSAAIDPVKKLKAQDVVDTYGAVTFTYTANNDFKTTTDGDKLAFRIEVKDSTGRIIKRELVNANRIYEEGKYDGYADAKHTINQYRYWINGLTRLSNYTVSVYAVYGNDQSGVDQSKPANTKLKTTNIPASYVDVPAKEKEGGVDLNVSVRDDSILALSEYPILKTGNKYTLSLPLNDGDVNKDAALMKTDTLTWKSSNAKAATVKANAGTFTATLTAVKKGTTTISVTSKVTKKVIAKWVVVVNAVGEADGYYGDNVLAGYNYWDDGNLDHDGAEVLTRNNPLSVTLQYGERRWVAFTAPEYGYYRVSVDNNGSFLVYNKEKTQRLGGFAGSYADEMEKGETWNLCIENANSKKAVTYRFTAGGSEYQTVAIGDGTKVRGGSTVRFIAPADNYYTFIIKQNGIEVSKESVSLSAGEAYALTVSGSSTEGYTVEVTARKAATALTVGKSEPVSLSENGEVIYQFTADKTSNYTFVTENASKSLEGYLHSTLYDAGGRFMEHYQTGEGEAATDNNVTRTEEIKKGDTVYIRLTSEEANTATLKVMQEAVVEEGHDQTVTIAADGGTEYITLEVPKDGDYRFKVSYTKPSSLGEGEDVVVYTSIYVNNGYYTMLYGDDTYEGTLRKGDVVRFEIYADTKDTKVTVAVEETSSIQAEYNKDTGANVSAGVSEWLTYNAANGDGWYDFTFTVKKKADGTVPDATAEIYGADRAVWIDSVSADGSETFTYVEYLEAGTVRNVKLTSTETAEVSVSMKVTKETVDKLEADKAYTLDPKEIRRFSWKADREGIYHFSEKITPENEITMYYSETPNRIGDEIASLDGQMSGYIKKGETFYLTLIAADELTAENHKATFTATIGERSVTSLTAEPIEIEPGEEKWVEFTARKTQRYQYAKKDADEVNIYKASSLEDGGRQFAFEGEEKYTAGQKQLFRVVNTTETKQTVTLTISEVVPVDFVQNQATATMKHGEAKWFRFKADTLGRYQFTAEAKSEGKTAEAVFTKYSDDWLNIAEERLNASVLDNKIVKAGAYAYLYVETSIIADEAADTTGDIAVTLKAVPFSQVEAGDQLEVEKEKAVDFTENALTKYLEFTAPADGLYTFMATQEDAEDGTPAPELTVAYYKNLESNIKTASKEFTLSLEKNDKLVIKLTSAGKQSIKVKIHQETVTKITESAQSYPVSDGDVLWFSVDSGESLRYFIEADAQEGLTLQAEQRGGSWGSAVGELSGNGFYYSYVGSVGGAERLLKITASVAEDSAESAQSAEKTFTIRKGLVTAETIGSGDSKEIVVADTKPNHMVWYRFTPEEAGRYVMKMGGEASARVREFTGGLLATGTLRSSFPYEMTISKSQVGQERFYAVYYTGNDAKNFNVSLYQAAAKTLTEASPVTVTTANVEAREKIWVSFKAPADGRYTFTNDSGIEIQREKYQAIDDSNSSSRRPFDWDEEICMSEGEEMLFAAYYYRKPEKESFHISVSSVKPEVLTVTENAVEIEFTDNDAKWFVFTASEAAIYQFNMTVPENGDVSGYRYSKLNDPDYDGVIRSGQTYGMSAGEKVYLKLQPSGIADDGKLTVSFQIAQTKKIVELELAENTVSGVAADSEKWAYFRADEAGFYRFDMSGSCTVERYDDVNDDPMAEYGDGGSFTYGLYKNDAIYFRVSTDAEDAVEEKITVTKGDEIRSLTAGGTDRVSVSGNKAAWYAIEIAETGLYKIAADNNAILEEYAGLNADGGAYQERTTSGFYLKEFEEGETVYLKVSTTYSSAQDINVSCTKVIEQDLYGEDEVSYTLNQGEVLLVRWMADSKGYYDFGYNADSYMGYTYYRNTAYNWASWTTKGWGYSWSSYQYEGQRLIESGEERYLLIEAEYGVSNVTVSAEKILRALYIGGTQYADLDGYEAETFRFTAGYTGKYLFYSENGYYDVHAYLRDENGNEKAADTECSGEGSNFRIVYDLTAGTEVRLEVYNNSYNSDYVYVGVSRYMEQDVPLGSDGSYTNMVTTEYGQEVWFTVTALQDGFYEFGSGDNLANLKLYTMDGDSLGEVLGSKSEYSSNPIKVWLDAGEKVMLRTYYNYHAAGTYEITVSPTEIEGCPQSDWDISVSYGNSTTSYFSWSSGQEAEIPCSFSKSGKYTFTTNGYDELVLALYVNDVQVETDSTSEIVYEYDAERDSEKTVILKAHYGRKYQAFGGRIHVACDYLRKVYELPVTGLTAPITVGYGQEAWLTFEAPVSEDDVRYTFTFADRNENNGYSYNAYRRLSLEDTENKQSVSFSYNSPDSGVYGVSAGTSETVYWCIRNQKSTDLMLDVAVDGVPVEVLDTTGIAEEFAAGAEKWYVFRAPEAGEYDFSFMSDISSSSSYCYVYGYSDLSGGSSLVNGRFNSSSPYGYSSSSAPEAFAEGKAVYWKIKNDSAEEPANVTIRVKKADDVAVTLDDAAGKSALIYPKLSQWFSFHSTEDARYTFTIANMDEEDTNYYNPYFYSERDTSSGDRLNTTYDYFNNSKNFSWETYIAADTTVYCYINNSYADDLEASVAVQKVPVREWTEAAVEIDPNTEVWYCYTSTEAEDAKYTFTFTSTTSCYSNLEIRNDLSEDRAAGTLSTSTSFSSEDGYSYRGTGDYFVPAHGTVYWKIKNTSAQTMNIKMKAEKIDITALTLGAEEDPVEVPARSSKWFSFESSKDARYAFTFTSSASVSSVTLYTALDAEVSTLDSGSSLRMGSVNGEYVGWEDWYIPVGETIYWKIDNTGNSSNRTVKVKVEEVEAETISEDIATNGIVIPAESGKWLSYTADESARYAFTLTRSYNGSNYYNYTYLYEDLSQKKNTVSYSSDHAYYEYYLEQGSTIYWKAANNYTTDITLTIQPKKIVTETLTVEESKQIALDADTQWLTFEVPETGIYDFTVSNDATSQASMVLKRYAALDADSAETLISSVSAGYSGSCKYSFTEGMEIYLEISLSNNSASSAEGTILVEKVAGTQTLTVDTGTEVAIDTATVKYQWLEFTAPDDGFYRFYSEGDSNPMVWLLDEVDVKYDTYYYQDPFRSAVSDDNSGADNNFYTRLEMEAGQNIYVLVGAPNFSTTVGELNTTVYAEPLRPMTISMEEAKLMSTIAGGYELLEFTAPADGEYIFYSSDNSGDPKAWFFKDDSIGYDATTSELESTCWASDDDGAGNNNNFSKALSLVEGQKVYIAVGHYSLGSSVTLTVHVTKNETAE